MAVLESSNEAQRAALLEGVHRADVTRENCRHDVDSLNAEMAKLQQRVQAANTRMRQATRCSLAASNKVSMFESRLLADAINQALPRELKDMIYYLCWNDTLRKYDDPRNMRPWRANDVTQAELDGDEDHPCEEYRFPPHPRGKAFEHYPMHHFADPAYVGALTAIEFVEVFCRIMPAYVETLDTEKLEDHFMNDDFGVGVPPCDFVTSITFFIDPCRQRSQCAFPWDDDNPGFHYGPKCLDDDALDAMRLAGPEKRDKLPEIVFFINADGMRVMETLTWSRTLYDQLKALGASITILYCCNLPYSGCHVEPFDLGTIMEKPESEWDAHFLNEIQKRAPNEHTSMSNTINYATRCRQEGRFF